MKNQLIPPPELAPPAINHLPFEKRIEIWAQLVDESESLLLTNIRSRLPPNGDWQEAYRQWYGRYMEEHDRAKIQFLENLTRLEREHGK